MMKNVYHDSYKTAKKQKINFITLPPEGVVRYCFDPVCLYVCLCVANIWLFYFSTIRRDIDLKFMQDTYRVVLNSLKKMTVKGQGNRDSTLLFEDAVIS